MSAPIPPLPREAPASAWMTALGIVFMLGWLGTAFVLGGLKLMASLMANDSGSASGSAHLAFLSGVMGGQVLTGLAGIPAGMAFFNKTRRKRLIGIFLILLLSGIALQVGSFLVFFP